MRPAILNHSRALSVSVDLESKFWNPNFSNSDSVARPACWLVAWQTVLSKQFRASLGCPDQSSCLTHKHRRSSIANDSEFDFAGWTGKPADRKFHRSVFPRQISCDFSFALVCAPPDRRLRTICIQNFRNILANPRRRWFNRPIN